MSVTFDDKLYMLWLDFTSMWYYNTNSDL